MKLIKTFKQKESGINVEIEINSQGLEIESDDYYSPSIYETTCDIVNLDIKQAKELYMMLDDFFNPPAQPH